jgi:hypothetical protein
VRLPPIPISRATRTKLTWLEGQRSGCGVVGQLRAPVTRRNGDVTPQPPTPAIMTRYKRAR